MTHIHAGREKHKIISLKGDRFYQTYKICDEDAMQFDYRLDELKKGPYRAGNR